MPPDLPPVTTPHSAQIIGANYPTTSETGTVASVIALFEQAAESVGTGSTAEARGGSPRTRRALKKQKCQF